MNPLKHKLANEWMRQDDATPEEALDTWNTMEAEFKLNRAALQEPRTMAQEPRNMYSQGQLVQNTVDGSRPGYSGSAFTKALMLLKNFNKTGAVKGLEEKLIKQYKSQGMEFLDAIKKAQTEAGGVRYEGKIKIIDDAMKETNVMSDDYVDLLDMKIKLEDPNFAKQYVNFSENLKNKTRSRYDSDWAEANFGEEYGTKLDQARVREINESIDPNITERSLVDDIDDMNTANIDEFFGRKKNADGGVQQLVSNTVDGSRPGYQGPGKVHGERWDPKILRKIKGLYLQGKGPTVLAKQFNVSLSMMNNVLHRLTKENILEVPKFTQTELTNKPNIKGLNQFSAVTLDPKKLEAIKKDASTLTKSEIIKKHNVSIQSLIKLEKDGKVKFPIRGVGKPGFKLQVTEDAKIVLKLLKSNPQLTTTAIQRQLGWPTFKTLSATNALKRIISPRSGAVRTGIEIPSSLKKSIVNLKSPMGTVEDVLLKRGVDKSKVDKIMRSRKAVSEFFPKGTNFEHHLPQNLFSYFKDKDIQNKLRITGSRTSPELNQFKLRYDRLMKGAVDEFLGSNGNSKDLSAYTKKIKGIRNTVRSATNGYEMGYIKYDLDKNPKPVLFTKSIDEGMRALGPESSQKLSTFKNTKYTKALLVNYKKDPNNPIYNTLKNYKLPEEITNDYINQYDKYSKEYKKIEPHLGSREKIINFAKKNLNNPIVKTLFKAPYGKATLVTAAALTPTALAAGETDVIDKAKSWPVEHPWLTGGAATGASKLTKADPLKYLRKAPRKILSSLGTPTGALAAWPLSAMGMKKAGWMEKDEPAFDIKSTGDRIGAEAELALAPSLVKWTDKLTKPIKNKAVRSAATQVLNLGMKLPMAMKVARIASPIGLLSLAGEGIYHAGKKEMDRRAQLSPEELADFHLKRQSRGWSEMEKAQGGIMNLKKNKW